MPQSSSVIVLYSDPQRNGCYDLLDNSTGPNQHKDRTRNGSQPDTMDSQDDVCCNCGLGSAPQVRESKPRLETSQERFPKGSFNRMNNDSSGFSRPVREPIWRFLVTRKTSSTYCTKPLTSNLQIGFQGNTALNSAPV